MQQPDILEVITFTQYFYSKYHGANEWRCFA